MSSNEPVGAGDHPPTPVRYKTLWIDDRPWDAADTARYVDRGYNSVGLTFTAKVAPSVNLEFLTGLPGLLSVYVHGPLRDDAMVFRLPGLKNLTVITRSAAPLRTECLGDVTDLAVSQRPALDQLSHLVNLEALTIFRWSGNDLAFLPRSESMVFLRMEGKRQRVSIRGIDACPNLDEIMLLDVCVESIDELRALNRLRKIHITGVRNSPARVPWDLEAIQGLHDLEDLRIPNCGPVRSLAPLLRLPLLKRLGVDVEVVDGDLTPLIALPDSVSIGSLSERKHHTHTERDIRRLRESRQP